MSKFPLNIDLSVAWRKRRQRLCAKRRAPQGNMLVLSTVLGLTILGALLGFAVRTMTLLNLDSLQRSAIDAASLAAAKDLSRIVVSTPSGFVGLCDSAPNGKATLAGDGFGVPVKSINTLFATVRLDLIIAEATQDQTMLALADRDYAEAMKARDDLLSLLQDAIERGGAAQARDANGGVVNPRDDALKAYLANIGAGADQKHFTLSLGMIKGGSNTTTPIPNPGQYAYVDSNQQSNGKYRAFVSVPYKGTYKTYDFVFAGGGQEVQLVDAKLFETKDDQLPYSMPVVVRAEADQLVQQPGGGQWIYVASCAQPLVIADPNAYPGALTISFPDGRAGFEQTIPTPGSIGTKPAISAQTVELSQALGGDYPGFGRLVNVPPSQHLGQTIGTAWSMILHDWIKRAGPKANVLALEEMLNSQFLSTASTSGTSWNEYTWNLDGTIQCSVFAADCIQDITVSEAQLYGVACAAGPSNIEVIIHDQCFSPAGLHAGEPIPMPILPASAILPVASQQFASFQFGSEGKPPNPERPPNLLPGSSFLTYPKSDGTNLMRPTYQQNGLTADITFHRDSGASP